MTRITLSKNGLTLLDLPLDTLLLMHFHAQGVAPELPVDVRVEIEDANYCGDNNRDVHYETFQITPADDDEYVAEENILKQAANALLAVRLPERKKRK